MFKVLELNNSSNINLIPKFFFIYHAFKLCTNRKKSNLESIPPQLLYQVKQMNFEDGLILRAIYHTFLKNNYISCIPWLSPIFTCIT